MMVVAKTLESVLKRNRLVVIVLLGVMAMAWLFLIDMAGMENMLVVMAIAMQGPAWGRRACPHVPDVGRNDGGHDAA